MMSSSPPLPPPPASSSQPVINVVSSSPRYLHWLCLIPPSLLALGSTIEAVRMERYMMRSAAAVPAAATATTTTPFPDRDVAIFSISSVFLLSLLYVASMYAPTALSSAPASLSSWLRRRTSRRPEMKTNRIELVVILVMTSLSITSLHSCTNPATGLAVNANGGIGFGNLYYSTWITTLLSLWLLTSYVRVEYGIDLHSELTSRGRRFRCWAVLVKTSIVVMGSAASCYDARCQYHDDVERVGSAEYCRRAAYGVASGCIGGAIGLAVTSSRLACASGGTSDEGRIVFVVECVSGTCLTIVYGFAAAYLTGEEGPGAPLGNLYYSTWITFGLALYVGGSCLEGIRRAASGAGGGRGTTMTTNGGGRDEYDYRTGQSSYHGDASDANVSSMGKSVRSTMGDDYAQRNHRPGVGYASSSSSSLSYFTDTTSMRSGSVGEVQVGV